jgi:hypothetical protein
MTNKRYIFFSLPVALLFSLFTFINVSNGFAAIQDNTNLIAQRSNISPLN